jgi:hypothetical protein
VTSLDAIIDQVSEMARADFAFVLTRRGRLATRNAPADMPESGRMAIVALADRQLRDKPGTVSHADIPREMLVPFGGAAPVDVYVAAREEAILCVVMATFAEQRFVSDAMEAGARALDKLLHAEAERRARRRPGKASKDREIPKPGKSNPGARRRLSAPPPPPSEPGLGPVFRNTIPEGLTAVKISEAVGPTDLLDDMPTITIASTKLGRATLTAIEIDRDAPEITYGQSTIGRATLSEIELSLVPTGDPRSSIPDIRLDVVSLPAIDTAELDVTDRMTLPFTERPEEAKRRFELAEMLSEGPTILETTKTRTVIAGKSKPSPKAARPPSMRPPKAGSAGPPKMPAPRLPLDSRDSNIELWHTALAETLEEPSREGPPKPRRSQPPPKAAVQWSRPDKGKPGSASDRPSSSPPQGAGEEGARPKAAKSVWPTGPTPKTGPKRKPLPPVAAVKRPSDKPKR